MAVFRFYMTRYGYIAISPRIAIFLKIPIFTGSNDFRCAKMGVGQSKPYKRCIGIGGISSWDRHQVKTNSRIGVNLNQVLECPTFKLTSAFYGHFGATTLFLFAS